MSLKYRSFTPDDLPAYERLHRQAYASSQGPRDWERVRLVAGPAGPLGFASFGDWGQWFGGRPVRAAGIASVMTAAEARGQGVARALLAGLLEELAEAGFAVSPLYYSTLPPYRALGWEQAGFSWRTRLPTRPLADLKHDMKLVPLAPAEAAEILKPLHRRHAAVTNGFLERDDGLWARLLKPKDQPADAYLIEGAEGPAGYLVADHSRWCELELLDWAAFGEGAARAILAYLGGARSMVAQALCRLGPDDALGFVLPDTQAGATRMGWALRIIDVVAALEGRGWPEGLEAGFDLRLDDPILPRNHGLFGVTIKDGRATVTQGGGAGPALGLGIATLSALHSGHMDARQLAAMGRIAGAPSAITGAALAFAGPRPWMSDAF